MARRTPHVVAAEFKRPVQELLSELYLERGLTVDQIARILRINKGTVSRWMQRYGIPARRPKWVLPDSQCASL